MCKMFKSLSFCITFVPLTKASHKVTTIQRLENDTNYLQIMDKVRGRAVVVFFQFTTFCYTEIYITIYILKNFLTHFHDGTYM